MIPTESSLSLIFDLENSATKKNSLRFLPSRKLTGNPNFCQTCSSNLSPASNWRSERANKRRIWPPKAMMGHDELEIRGTGRERGHRCRSGTRQEAVDDAAGAAVGAGMGGGAHALREATTHFSLPIQSLFPFLYFMIRDLHIAKQVEDIGFYAGFVGASYMLGRALTSTVWGIVADKHGRKPVLVITLIAVITLNTLFGLSSSYWMALTTRGFLGLLSGMLGPIKAYATEVCRKEYSHLALSLISSSRAIGLIVGPAIGGYLAQPADKYPGMFSQESIFGRFPYFLPCLCVSILAVAALISCIWLPETLHKHNEATDSNNSTEAMEESLSDTNAEESGGGYWSLFTNWPLMSTITVYCLFSLQDVAYAEVFSLWAVSDRKYGGLSFTSTDVGRILALSGLFLLIYQILIYPSVAKAIEPITLVRATAILTLPLLASYPFMTTLYGFNLQLVVNCASSLKNSFQVTTITVCNILMNDAVSQDLRASANGLSVTLMSIFKAIAPAVAGVIFSWAQRRQSASFLPGDHLVFFMLNAATVVGLMCTFGPHFARGNMKH